MHFSGVNVVQNVVVPLVTVKGQSTAALFSAYVVLGRDH